MRKLALPSDWDLQTSFILVFAFLLSYLVLPVFLFSWLCLVSSNYVVYLLKYIDVELKTGGTHAH